MRRRFMLNNTEVPLENHIYAKHISEGQGVKLCGDISDVKYMVIDGKYSDPVEYYTFSSNGEHEVYYCMNENTISLYYFFTNCDTLTYVDFINFDSSHVINMNSTFVACNLLDNPNLSHLDTSNVTNMSSMFYANNFNTLDLSKFNTSKVTRMDTMFRNCYGKIKELDLSSFDTSNVVDMTGMLETCSNSLKTINLSSFNTSKVKYMSTMFGSCHALERLDLSSFTFDANPNTGYMFEGCLSLRYIKIMNELKGTTFDTAFTEGLPSDGVFECNKNFDYTEFTKYLPQTWTVNRV